MTESRLILGTVQLGMQYGIANATGQPDRKAAADIVRTAWEGGVKEFDTAQGYGQSEAVLGAVLKELGMTDKALVNSKPDHGWDGSDFNVLERDLDASLERLGVPGLNALLLHREHLLEGWDQAMTKRFQTLKSSGRIGLLGISVYSPEAALRALGTEGIDIVQIPTNLLDRRFERAGVAEAAASRGKHIQIRSIFLQGLVFLTPETLPHNMRFAAKTIALLDAFTRELDVDRLQASMGFIRDAWPGCSILFGAETAEQVRTNLDAFDAPCPESLINRARQVFSDIPETILNPTRWNTR